MLLPSNVFWRRPEYSRDQTSLKVNFSKYLETAQNGGLYTISNPAVTFQQTTTRGWTDGNRNYNPDCDLMNPAAQNNLASGGDLCGVWNNSNFGNPLVTTSVNPDVQHGWGVRQYDWQFGIAVPHTQRWLAGDLFQRIGHIPVTVGAGKRYDRRAKPAHARTSSSSTLSIR